MVDLLFVYGSLLSGSDSAVRRSVEGSIGFVARGAVRGRLYEVSGYPGLVEAGEPGDKVWGEVYRLHDPGVVLRVLDEYEESSVAFPEPREYRREKLRVDTDDGKSLQAWAYVYNRPVGGLPRIDSGDYAAVRRFR